MIWSEEALAFLGPHEHLPVADGVEMSTPLGQETSEKETQFKSHLHSLAAYLASRSLRFLICGNEADPSQPPGDAGSIMEPVPMDRLGDLEDATPTPGIIQVFLVPAWVGN